jgi:phospholipase/carboxylesterase
LALQHLRHLGAGEYHKPTEIMNRLSPLSGPGSHLPSLSTGPQDVDTAEALFATTRRNVRYAVFAPLHYESNYAYPLILWMHGSGFDERQLIRVMPFISMQNFVAAAPRAPWASGERGGFEWRNLYQATTVASQLIFECIDQVAEQYHIDRQRVFLAGYQSGGETAMRVALRHPDRFAGAIAINGAFPRRDHPLGSLENVRNLPLLLLHGENSTWYPLSQLCEDMRLFHSAGMQVTVRQFPVADEFHARMLADINVWVMERVTGQSLFPTQFVQLPATTRSN